MALKRWEIPADMKAIKKSLMKILKIKNMISKCRIPLMGLSAYSTHKKERISKLEESSTEIIN